MEGETNNQEKAKLGRRKQITFNFELRKSSTGFAVFLRVKRAVKVAYPGCYFGGITLRSGKRGFAIYKEGKVIEQYSAIGPGVK